jgi:hypothetical protein
MKIVLLKANLSEIKPPLEDIAKCLRAICKFNNIPLEDPVVPEFEPVSYTTDEYTQIVTEHKSK